MSHAIWSGQIVFVCVLKTLSFFQVSFSNNLKTRRQLLPTVLSDQGQIAIPGRSGRRRQNETLEAAKVLHGASSDNMSPAYDGLAAVLNSKASVAELFNIIKKCKKIRDKAIPMLVKGEIKNFEESSEFCQKC